MYEDRIKQIQSVFISTYPEFTKKYQLEFLYAERDERFTIRSYYDHNIQATWSMHCFNEVAMIASCNRTDDRSNEDAAEYYKNGFVSKCVADLYYQIGADADAIEQMRKNA